MKPTDQYLYPVLPKTLEDFADQITTPVQNGQSVSLVFPHLQGGERAWVRFCLAYPEATRLSKNLKPYQVVCFDPTEVIDSSHSAFLYHMLELLNPRATLPDYSDLSLQNIIKLLKSQIAALLKNQEIVIFILKLNSFPNLSPQLGNILYSLWQPYKRHLHFVTTLTPETIVSQLPDLVGDFTETLTENIRYIPKLSNSDIIQSITHWEHILKKQLSSTEKSALLKYSQNSAYISKILTQNLVQPYSQSPQEVCQKIISQQFGILRPIEPLTFDDQKHILKIGSTDVASYFSPQELAVLSLLFSHTKETVSRDVIAQSLWGNESAEKYSDWAIDKFISLIRQKLTQLNSSTKIKTIKNQGYLLEV